LGPFPNPVYENTELDLAKDDRLVLYTDGIIETTNSAGTLFGNKRLVSFFEEHAIDSAEQTTEQFLSYLARWTGKPNTISYNDDLTLLIVDITS
jgi:sigma-B regulation protein RsbU (phosphoserine phosphatase)